MFTIVIGLGAGFSVGAGIFFLISSFLQRQKIYHTKQSARHIVQKAKDKEEHLREQVLNKEEEYKDTLMRKQEKEVDRLTRVQQDLQTEIEYLSQQTKEDTEQLKKKKNKLTEEMTQVLNINKTKKEQLTQILSQLKEKKEELIQILKNKFNINIEKWKTEQHKKLLTEAKEQGLQQIKEKEEYFKHNIDQQACFILELALSRFRQAYCPERSIKNINWGSQHAMKKTLGPNLEKIKVLEKECGVDMKVSETEPSISVIGIDPVRKELGRASLQRIANKRHVKTSDIKGIVDSCKKELFRQIKHDGQKICHALRLKDVKTEIKNMMGALRYRYSFAQNQYFHCQEVGWLCGLLNSELRGSLFAARKAGMFHDIGKAMDHSKEGGHAVIGADFIEKHGEANPAVIHAVKAHHYDVTPKEPLDFLVISADALSGARPGARRSTVDSYNQKVLTLEKIGRSFEGVKDTYIMNAGREIRVIVDSKKINDVKALELSKKIAGKIEEECSYPGLIKVTVVRTVTKSATLPSFRPRHSRTAG